MGLFVCRKAAKNGLINGLPCQHCQKGCKERTVQCRVESYDKNVQTTPTSKMECSVWCPRNTLGRTSPLKYYEKVQFIFTLRFYLVLYVNRSSVLFFTIGDRPRRPLGHWDAHAGLTRKNDLDILRALNFLWKNK